MQLLKTANSNDELVYAIRHFNTFYIGADVRLLKNEGRYDKKYIRFEISNPKLVKHTCFLLCFKICADQCSIYGYVLNLKIFVV